MNIEFEKWFNKNKYKIPLSKNNIIKINKFISGDLLNNSEIKELILMDNKNEDLTYRYAREWNESLVKLSELEKINNTKYKISPFTRKMHYDKIEPNKPFTDLINTEINVIIDKMYKLETNLKEK
jgi:hypothetical protein